MKNWYIKALRAEKERQEQKYISIGHMHHWWTKGRGSFNTSLYIRISQIKSA
jgi:hypothetical protein